MLTESWYQEQIESYSREGWELHQPCCGFHNLIIVTSPLGGWDPHSNTNLNLRLEQWWPASIQIYSRKQIILSSYKFSKIYSHSTQWLNPLLLGSVASLSPVSELGQSSLERWQSFTVHKPALAVKCTWPFLVQSQHWCTVLMVHLDEQMVFPWPGLICMKLALFKSLILKWTKKTPEDTKYYFIFVKYLVEKHFIFSFTAALWLYWKEFSSCFVTEAEWLKHIVLEVVRSVCAELHKNHKLG